MRLIYYYFPDTKQIWLMTLYGKDEAADLTAGEKRLLKAAIEAELDARHLDRVKKSRRRP